MSQVKLVMYNVAPNAGGLEIVERKGLGHPDTLCDAIAERISASYSLYCLDNYGVILRHMIDKLSIIGGKSHVEFGKGEMLEPVRLYLSGRFTTSYMGEKIPYLEIATKAIKDHLMHAVPLLDTEKWLKIIDNTHPTVGPGVVYLKDGTTKNKNRKDFFVVHDQSDVERQSNDLRANDTVAAVASFPPTPAERCALNVEKMLNTPEYKRHHPYIGSDIKIMVVRNGNCLDISACIPMIAKHTPTPEAYTEHLKIIEADIRKQAAIGNMRAGEVTINSRDDIENDDLYLTAVGSSIESGDEGVVGRGNRIGGVISYMRPMSLEAACGKNPVYHAGKVYTALCGEVARKIYEICGVHSTVYMVSRMGSLLENPWRVVVEINENTNVSAATHLRIEHIIRDELEHIPDVTNAIIHGGITLY